MGSRSSGGHRGSGGHGGGRSHYHGGHYGHHHYGRQDDSCELFLCLVALLGACIPPEKKVHSSICCQFTRLVMLVAAIVCLVVYFSVTQIVQVFSPQDLDQQFPYQIYIDPYYLREQSGTGLSLTYKIKEVPGYDFYRCDMNVNDYTYSKGEAQVKGDFIYQGGDENETFWAKGGNYVLKDKYGTYDMNTVSTSSYTTYYADYYVQISQTNNATYQFQFNYYKPIVINQCSKIQTNEWVDYRDTDDIYGYPNDTTDGKTSVKVEMENKKYKVEGAVGVVGIVLIVLYLFVGLTSLLFYQNCTLCCGLFCCKSQAFKNLQNPQQQVTIVQQEVSQQPPPTIIIQQPAAPGQPDPVVAQQGQQYSQYQQPTYQQPVYQQPQQPQYPQTTVLPPM